MTDSESPRPARHRAAGEAGPPALHPTHTQAGHRVRHEWGQVGARAVLPEAGAEGAFTYAVVVDVLSFTTTLCVAAERGMTVLPYRWGDEEAAAYAEEHDAVLALGRMEAQAAIGPGVAGRAPISLSPAHMAEALPVPRVVLPSPNGSTLCFELAATGSTVVGACLRNRHAVARWLQPRLGEGAVVAIIAAGERWADGSLRVAVEDQWGAGAVVDALEDLGVTGISGEALAAAEAFRAVEHRMLDMLSGCASGLELSDVGFADDLRIAARTDASTVVPVLEGPAFGHD